MIRLGFCRLAVPPGQAGAVNANARGAGLFIESAMNLFSSFFFVKNTVQFFETLWSLLECMFLRPHFVASATGSGSGEGRGALLFVFPGGVVGVV